MYIMYVLRVLGYDGPLKITTYRVTSGDKVFTYLLTYIVPKITARWRYCTAPENVSIATQR